MVDEIERVTYEPQSIAKMGASLSNGTTETTGFASATNGYRLGGWAAAAAHRSRMDKLSLGTEVLSLSGESLSRDSSRATAVGVSGAGYLFGGQGGGSRQAEIQKVNTTTDVVSVLAAILNSATEYLACTGNTAKAVIGGGRSDAGSLATLQNFTYSLEAMAPAGNQLLVESEGLAASGSNKTAVFAGGTGGEEAESSVQTVSMSTGTVVIHGFYLTKDRVFYADTSISDYSPAA